MRELRIEDLIKNLVQWALKGYYMAKSTQGEGIYQVFDETGIDMHSINVNNKCVDRIL